MHKSIYIMLDPGGIGIGYNDLETDTVREKRQKEFFDITICQDEKLLVEIHNALSKAAQAVYLQALNIHNAGRGHCCLCNFPLPPISKEVKQND